MIGSWVAVVRRRFSQDGLFWACAATVILLVPILLVVAWRATTLEQAQQDAAHAAMVRSAERRAQVQALALALKDVESSHRGYLLAGDPSFLRRYHAAAPDLDDRFAQLHLAFADQPDQQARVSRARELAAQRMEVMEATRRARDVQGLGAASAIVATRRGENLMEQLRAVTDEITAAEARNLSQRLEQSNRQTLQARRVASISFMLVLAAILAAAVMAFRYTNLRTKLITRARAEAERRQAIFDSAMDAIVTFNPSGGIETMNRAAEEMFGYSVTELVGRDISILVPDAMGGDAVFLDRLRNERNLRQGSACEFEARRKDGATFPVDINFGEMHQPDGVHAVAVMRDCTERRKAELAKSEFVSTVSHELRTPLTSIAGSLGLLVGGAGGALPEKAGRLIAIAESNSRRLVRLINDILDMEKIQSGKLTFTLRPLDLGDLAQRAIDGMSGLSSETGVTLAYVAPDGPVTVHGDADRLTQVVTNLISNALKFSPRGGTVQVMVEVAGRHARLRVSDQGPGIPAEFRERIFGRFAQADSSDTRQKGGTGLGLAISKEIVERHGGRIWFESTPGLGATIFFELAAQRPAAGAPAARTGNEPRVLLCEDDPDVSHVLAEALRAQGFAVEATATLKETQTALASGRPFDVLLLDIRLPDGSGLDLLRRMRADPAMRHLPTIIISGDRADREAMAGLGLVDWIEKPVDMSRLQAALGQAVDTSDHDGPLVLHVDDDPDLRHLVEEALSGRCRLVSAESLAAARSRLAEATPDLVILDVGLPDGSGLDLLGELVDKDGRPIPVVVFSAQAFDEGKIADAVDAVLVKSRTSLGQLVATVRRLCAATAAEPAET